MCICPTLWTVATVLDIPPVYTPSVVCPLHRSGLIWRTKEDALLAIEIYLECTLVQLL